MMFANLEWVVMEPMVAVLAHSGAALADMVAAMAHIDRRGPGAHGCDLCVHGRGFCAVGRTLGAEWRSFGARGRGLADMIAASAHMVA